MNTLAKIRGIILCGLFILLFSFIYAADTGYKISVKLSNSNDTALLLAHYYGNKQYLDDTAFRSKQGVFIFQGTKKLKEGMYIVAGQNKSKYFYFFMTGSQQFEFSCDPLHIMQTMQLKGSQDNKLFYEYIGFLSRKQSEIEPLGKWLKAHANRTDSASLIRKKIENIDAEVKSYISGYYKNHNGLLSAAFIKAGNEPDYLSFCKKPDGNIDSSRVYQAYKAHYFDNFTFSDPRLIYTTVFSQKIDYFFDKVAVPMVDSLKKEIDALMVAASVNKEMQSFLGWYLSLKFETSEIMGQDALFVYLVRNYLENDKVPWQFPDVKPNVLKRVNMLEPLLIGKVAPNLILLDTNNMVHSLSNTVAHYTLLFFWESICSHCQQEMPKVIKFYNEFHMKYDLEIFAVSTDTSLVKWKEFIRKNNMEWINVNGHLSISGNYHTLYDIRSTPIMYLLDEDKKIIAKFLLTDDLANLIRRREENKLTSPANQNLKNE